MSKSIPSVMRYMSTSPRTVSTEQTISAASKMMSEHGIRHLPVLRGDKLEGILSSRDVALIETLTGVDPEVVTVEDAMSPAPYVTSPNAPVDAVCAEMAEHKYGAAVVSDNGKVVGVFTTVDVCRALAEVFKTRLK